MEEIGAHEVEEKVPSPPPTHQVILMEVDSPPQGKKKKTLKKVWSKANERLKKIMNVSMLPPNEVDHLYFKDQGKIQIFS